MSSLKNKIFFASKQILLPFRYDATSPTAQFLVSTIKFITNLSALSAFRIFVPSSSHHQQRNSGEFETESTRSLYKLPRAERAEPRSRRFCLRETEKSLRASMISYGVHATIGGNVERYKRSTARERTPDRNTGGPIKNRAESKILGETPSLCPAYGT